MNKISLLMPGGRATRFSPRRCVASAPVRMKRGGRRRSRKKCTIALRAACGRVAFGKMLVNNRARKYSIPGLASARASSPVIDRHSIRDLIPRRLYPACENPNLPPRFSHGTRFKIYKKRYKNR